MLTCEHRRRIRGVPIIAEPVAAPAPPAAAATVETQEVPVAAAAAQNRTRQFEPRNAESTIQPFERRLTFFFIEGLTKLCIEADVLCDNVPCELLLAGDNRLVFLKACREEYLSEIDFREPERASVLILLALEAVVVLRSAPDWHEIERLGAVDDERSGTLHGEGKAVVPKRNDTRLNFIVGEAFGASLVSFAIQLRFVQIQATDGKILDLIIGCSFHCTLPCTYAVPPSHPMCEAGSAYRRFSPQDKSAETVSLYVLW